MLYSRYMIKNNKIKTATHNNLIFSDITNVNDYVLYHLFHYCSDIRGSVSFPDLATIKPYGLSYAFMDCTGVTSISFPELTTIGTCGMAYAFNSCTGITGTVSFPELTTINREGLSGAFASCTGITSVSFPKLAIANVTALQNAFNRCTGITGTVSFPELTSIDTGGLQYAFYGCTRITSVSFPKLTTVGGTGLSQTFYGCTSLTGSVSFPKLTSIGSNGMSDTFAGTGVTELHFRADAKNTIESNSSYSYKFGATNATIYFDLGVAYVTINPNISDCTIYFNNSIATNPLSMIVSQENKYYVYKDGYCLYIGSKTPSSSDEGTNITENVTMTSTGNTATLNISIPQNLENPSATVDLTVEYIVDGITFKTDNIIGASVGTTQTSTSLIVPANTEITYKIRAEGYTTVTSTTTPSNNTINVTLEETNVKIVELAYPFTNDTEYLTNLVDNNNFIILDNTKTPASCIASGPKSYNVNSGFSTGYIQFTTPDTDDTELLTLSVTCTNNAESSYDYGVVFINTTGTMPTSNVAFTTAAGSVNTTYGEVLFQGRSNQSTTFRTATKVLTKNTTYYLCFYYRKDSSTNSGWDRFAIQNIKIPVAI